VYKFDYQAKNDQTIENIFFVFILVRNTQKGHFFNQILILKFRKNVYLKERSMYLLINELWIHP